MGINRVGNTNPLARIGVVTFFATPAHGLSRTHTRTQSTLTPVQVQGSHTLGSDDFICSCFRPGTVHKMGRVALPAAPAAAAACSDLKRAIKWARPGFVTALTARPIRPTAPTPITRVPRRVAGTTTLIWTIIRHIQANRSAVRVATAIFLVTSIGTTASLNR